MNIGLETNAIYLDFIKTAVNIVRHMRLLHTFKQVRIRGKILKWIDSFWTKTKDRGFKFKSKV